MSQHTVAVIVTLNKYDFDAQQVHITVGGHEAVIPLTDMIHPCLDRPTGVVVTIDDTMTGHVLMMTDEWSLVLPTTSSFPVVVSTRRVSFPSLPKAA